ncbi:MAG: hypothetical protein WB559_15550 [Candidatus Acidiferrales bacterium]
MKSNKPQRTGILVWVPVMDWEPRAEYRPAPLQMVWVNGSPTPVAARWGFMVHTLFATTLTGDQISIGMTEFERNLARARVAA